MTPIEEPAAIELPWEAIGVLLLGVGGGLLWVWIFKRLMK